MPCVRARWPLVLAAALLLVASAAAAGDPPRTQGLDAIIIADRQKGPGGTEASEKVMNALLDGVREMGFDVNVRQLPPDRISPGNILGAIRSLDAARMKDRTLLIYYAGHGGTDPRSGHFLQTPGGPLPRSQLLREITAKSPALALVVTDCCSTESTLNAKAIPLPAQLPPDRRAAENLLFQHRGVVDINGSSAHRDRGIHQAAFYHPVRGGLFTGAFASLFRPDVRTPRPGLAPEGLDEYLPRFGFAGPWQHEVVKDGFLEWREALDYLGDTLLDRYEEFREEVRSDAVALWARPEDVRMLLSQVSQDPQVFGPLAVRADRANGQVADVPALRPMGRSRFGVTVEERADRGGAYLAITRIEPGSPATRVLVWKDGRRTAARVPMLTKDTIVRANGTRVRSLGEFLHVLDSIPAGGELNIMGRDARTGRPYEASVTLDGYR